MSMRKFDTLLGRQFNYRPNMKFNYCPNMKFNCHPNVVMHASIPLKRVILVDFDLESH